MNDNTRWLLVLAVAAGVIALVVMNKNNTSTTPPAVQNSTCTGSGAADFNFIDIAGKPLKLSALRGKVVILDFWATWCPPCRMEIPGFIELQKQYGKDGLVVVGIALDDEGKVKDYVNSNGINYQVAIGGQEIEQAYGGIQGIPTTFIIDKKGCIAGKHVGYRPKEVFEQEFLKLK